MSTRATKAIDGLYPLLLKEWKDSWVKATNSPGELKCQVEAAWGDGFADGDALIRAMDAAGVDAVVAANAVNGALRGDGRGNRHKGDEQNDPSPSKREGR